MSATRSTARLAFEGVVIIVSILLAFSIDAAWAGRQDRLRERAALAALHDDAVANAIQLAEVIENGQQRHAATLAFFESDVADLVAIPADGAQSLIRSLTVPNRASLQSGVVDGLMASGRLGIITDPRLQKLLADWPSAAARLDRRSDMLVQLEAQLLQGLGRHSDVHAWLMGSRSAVSLDFSSLREDAKLMATLSTMQREREIYATVLLRLAGELNVLIEALEGARE
jgi:hypothetical protein